MDQHETHRLKRRRRYLHPTVGLLITGLVASMTIHASAPAQAALPTAQPVSSTSVHDRIGVGNHTTFMSANYQYRSAVWNRLDDLGVTWVRDKLVMDPSQPAALNASLDALDKAADRGIKILVVPIPESSTKPSDWTPADVRTFMDRLKAVGTVGSANNVPIEDVIYGFEGLNEPNQNRGGGGTTPGWENVAVNLQQALHQKREQLFAGKRLLGPSLHDVKADQANGAHEQALMDAGIATYIDRWGIHSYPGARPPLHKLQERIDRIIAAGYSGGLFITEWGYQNALNRSGGHHPIDEANGGLYEQRGALEIAGLRKTPYSTYELLDDPDSGTTGSGCDKNSTALNDIESNFGLIRVGDCVSDGPSAWSNKPAFTQLSNLLTQLNDPGPPYTPAPVQLEVVNPSGEPIKHLVTAKRNGQVFVWIWRDESLWNIGTQTTPGSPRQLNPATITVHVDEQVTSGTTTRHSVSVGRGIARVALTP